MGISWPLQNAHPLGGKLKLNTLISPINWPAMHASCGHSNALAQRSGARENSKRGNDEIDGQEGHHVVVGQPTACETQCGGVHVYARRGARILVQAWSRPE